MTPSPNLSSRWSTRARRVVSAGMAAIYFLTMCPGQPTAWGDILDFFSDGRPRQNDERQKPGYQSPEALKQYLDYKNRAAKAQTQAEEMINRQKSKVTDKVQSNVDKNL